MKALLFLFILAVQLQVAIAQQSHSGYVFSVRIPDSATVTVDAMAGFINASIKKASDKIDIIYDWVTTNIKYDTDSHYYFNWSKPAADIASTTLKRRKGVCENYATLFTALLVKTGIPSYVVNGYTRLSGTVSYIGHSWSAVKLNNEWFLCDPTWDAGNRPRWFLVAPDNFIDTHMPFDPMWQLLNYPLSHNEFKNQYRAAKKNKPFFNYIDSVKTFLQLDSLQQLEAFTKRMYESGLENNQLKLWHSYNEMKIAIIYGDKDMELYNAAVALLNKASSIFNEFVQYRNNQFLPAKPDDDIKNLLQPVNGLISSAKDHIKQMGLVVENFQYNPDELNQRLASLSARVKQQQDFIELYLHTKPSERIKLFLK